MVKIDRSAPEPVLIGKPQRLLNEGQYRFSRIVSIWFSFGNCRHPGPTLVQDSAILVKDEPAIHERGPMGQRTSVAELTDKQAEALALVHEGYESKEIARILKIAPSTVDQRIDAARRKLGASSRAEAGRLYAARVPIPDRFIYEPTPLTPECPPAPTSSPPRDELQFRDAMFDERAPWDRKSPWHLPRIAPRDLGMLGRMLVILALALMMLLGAGEAIDLFRGIGGAFAG